MKAPKTTIGRWLFDREIKQSEFARMLGVSQVQVSNYVRGRARPGREMALQIARLTGIPVIHLLYSPDELGGDG